MAVSAETATGQPNGQTSSLDDGSSSPGLMSEEAAIAHIAGLLEPEPTKAREPEDEEREPDPPPEQEAQEEAQEEPAEKEKADEAEAEADSLEELPETLEALAEALDMTPEDFMGHVKVKVKVLDDLSEVTLNEALRGYQRDQDYLRRKDEIAEQRRQMTAQSEAFDTERSKQLEEIGVLHQALTQRVGGYTPEMMLRIRQEHGEEAYLQAQISKQHDEDLLSKVREQGQKLTQEYQQKAQNYRAEQQRLLAASDADFRDSEKSRAAQAHMSRYLTTKGFTSEEVDQWFGGPFDHRHVGIIRDAARYRELMEKSKEVGKPAAKPKPKFKRAGSSVDHTPPSKVDSLRSKVRKARHGSRQDQEAASVALISEMIRSKGE